MPPASSPRQSAKETAIPLKPWHSSTDAPTPPSGACGCLGVGLFPVGLLLGILLNLRAASSVGGACVAACRGGAKTRTHRSASRTTLRDLRWRAMTVVAPFQASVTGWAGPLIAHPVGRECIRGPKVPVMLP
jgi:hypothetical protein